MCGTDRQGLSNDRRVRSDLNELKDIHRKRTELTPDELQMYSMFACETFIATNGQLPVDIVNQFGRNGIQAKDLIDLCLESVWHLVDLPLQ